MLHLRWTSLSQRKKIIKWMSSISHAARTPAHLCLGFILLHPSNKDYVLVRNVKDGGNPYKDQFKSWALDKYMTALELPTSHPHRRFRSAYQPEQLRQLEETWEAVLGPLELMSDKKAKFDRKTSSYIGGLRIKRTDQAVSMRNGNQCYFMSTTFQDARSLDAPSAGSKYRAGMDDDIWLRNEIIRVHNI
jgi:hypothetical protein